MVGTFKGVAGSAAKDGDPAAAATEKSCDEHVDDAGIGAVAQDGTLF